MFNYENNRKYKQKYLAPVGIAHRLISTGGMNFSEEKTSPKLKESNRNLILACQYILEKHLIQMPS